MISGALLLSKEEDIKTLYKKRILRIVIVILIASFVQYLDSIKNDFTIFNLGIFFKTIYTKEIITSYWFLYCYLIFLVLLPFLRTLVKNMKNEHYYYLFGIYIIYQIIVPVINQIFDITLAENLNIFILESNIFYPLLGYFCSNILDLNKINKKIILLFSITVCILLMMANILTIAEVRKTGNPDTETYFQYGEAFVAMYTYILIKKVFENKKLPKYINKTILIIGENSFGIYLIGSIIRRLIGSKIMTILAPYVTAIPATIIGCLCIIAISTVITMLLRKIPYVKKLI